MTSLPPIRSSIRVSWNPQQAFDRFVGAIGQWWPLASHSVGGPRSRGVTMTPGVGGEIVEQLADGREAHWGTITQWEPPHRLAFTWHPGRAATRSTRVELAFVPEGGGTRVALTHSGWEALGTQARTARRGYPIGWAYVLRLYGGRTASPMVLAVGALQWLLQPVAARMAAKAGPMVTRPATRAAP